MWRRARSCRAARVSATARCPGRGGTARSSSASRRARALRLGDKERRGARAGGLPEELVAVGAFPGQGHEEAAPLHGAGIDGHRGDALVPAGRATTSRRCPGRRRRRKTAFGARVAITARAPRWSPADLQPRDRARAGRGVRGAARDEAEARRPFPPPAPASVSYAIWAIASLFCPGGPLCCLSRAATWSERSL